MALPFYNWSMTASSNATADATVNWSEGQLPSTVNDSARAMMASTAAFAHDIAGGITTAGTSTAYTVSSGQVFDSLSHLTSQMIAFNAHATNTNTVGIDVTLNVDGLGAKPIRMQPSVALPNGSLILGTVYVVMYNFGDGVFYLRNMTNPYSIPIAGGMDFWGTTAPNSSFAFPLGQTLSRTTYATLFSIMGTTYGAGDGSTTFALPDKGGRVSAMKEASASRLTTAGSSIDGATMGAAGGAQNVTLAQANLPNIAPTFTGSAGTATSTNSNVAVNANATNFNATIGGGGAVPSLTAVANLSSTFTPAGTISSINGNVTQTATNNVPPLIVCNYIIRVI